MLLEDCDCASSFDCVRFVLESDDGTLVDAASVLLFGSRFVLDVEVPLVELPDDVPLVACVLCFRFPPAADELLVLSGSRWLTRVRSPWAPEELAVSLTVVVVLDVVVPRFASEADELRFVLPLESDVRLLRSVLDRSVEEFPGEVELLLRPMLSAFARIFASQFCRDGPDICAQFAVFASGSDFGAPAVEV